MSSTTILGYPREITHSCGARAVHLSSSDRSATYECRGTPTDPKQSAYGDDRCGAVFERFHRSDPEDVVLHSSTTPTGRLVVLVLSAEMARKVEVAIFDDRDPRLYALSQDLRKVNPDG